MNKKIPQRQCVGCRTQNDKLNMIRIVKNNEDQFFVDVTGKKNGRGAYICKSMECFQKAMKSKALDRSLKSTIPAEVYETLTKEMMEIE